MNFGFAISGVIRNFGLATFRSSVKFQFSKIQELCEISVLQPPGVM